MPRCSGIQSNLDIVKSTGRGFFFTISKIFSIVKFIYKWHKSALCCDWQILYCWTIYMKCTDTKLFNVASVIPFNYVLISWFGYNLLKPFKKRRSKSGGIIFTISRCNLLILFEEKTWLYLITRLTNITSLYRGKI